MSVESLNGFVLLSQRADWSDAPKWSLAWDTEVAGTLRGNEGRSALREMPRPTLQYSAKPASTEDQARLTGTLLVGLATGKVCAPLFGRASWLAVGVAAGATTVRIEPSAWAWKVGDYLVLYPDAGSHTARQITAIDATGTVFTVLALDALVSSGGPVYPVFSGRPEVDVIEQTSGEISAMPIRIIGDEYAISPDVPACCVTGPMAPAFDFAVLRYQPANDGGGTLIPQTAVLSPAIPGDVSYFRLAVIPAGTEQSPPYVYGPGGTPSSAQAYLVFGGHFGDNTGKPEGVLVNFARLAADYPSLATISIRLRAYWRLANGTGHVNIQCTTYAGGTMQGGTYQGDSRGSTPDDFTSLGGKVVQTLNLPVTITVGAGESSDPNGQDCGSLMYVPSTHALSFVPAH